MTNCNSAIYAEYSGVAVVAITKDPMNDSFEILGQDIMC